MANKVYDEKIGKSTDWGGDKSTGNLPVAGNRVQEFIKEQLNSKAGNFYYDTANNRYIVFADKESQVAYLADPTQTRLIIGTFDAPFNYSAKITLSTPTYVAILSGTKNNYIDFTFDTTNKSGQSVGEDVICTYTFIKAGIKKVVTEKYRYGQFVHFNVDDYIATGTNTITVGIVGQNTLAATTIGITYQVVDLQLSDTYDISQSYNLSINPSSVAAIPYAVSGYGTKVMEWYLDGMLLDYVKVEDEIVDVATTRTKYISLANLSQRIHSLQYRAYTMVDGEKFYSDILYRDLIVYTGVNRVPIIAAGVTIPVGNDVITSGNLQLFGITQYIPYDLTFAVYNPSGVASTEATISIDGKQEAVIGTHNGEVATYSLRPTEYGVKTLAITAGNTVYTIRLNISKSSTSLEPVTNALQLDLQALGKSNNDVNREEWIYGLYAATFTGFNWNKTSGWNNNRLMISAGAYVDVSLPPLTPDPTSTGKTLEFEFATANVSDDNAVICDLRNNAGTGLLITASEVILKSAGGAEVSTKFKSEENVRVAFVINRKTGVANKGLAFIYVNGVLSGSVNYAATDNFTSDQTLRIGNTRLADVQLKALRFYNTALTSDQILNNYILYRDTTDELLSIYDKNNIYEEGTQDFSVDKLAAQCPVFIFTGDIPALENTTDKNKTIYVDVEYINMQDPTRSFTGKGIRLRPQGTSSMGYPKKNFRPYTGYGTVWDNLGNIMVNGLYAFKEGSQPVNVWCLKADYAESSGTHNTGIARLWNQVMTNAQINGEYVLRTAAQKAALAAGYKYDVRTTVDGFPVNVFYRLTADSELIYIGKYNFNNDKSTESVFGFRDIPGFDNSRMQCWEVLNNGNHLALFQDMTNFDSEWQDAFEARYPDKSEDTTDLKAFCEWIVSTKNDIAKFKAEKWDHLDVYKVAAYYVYLMRFAAVDQVVKNAMMASEDGSRFYYINYDNDTIIGVRNDGLLIYDYEIDRQTVDTSFSALVYAYAGHDSTLWNNLEADEEFMRIVSEVDNALYIAGMTYEKTIDMFDNKQVNKWCERVYNQDAQYKYVSPYTDSGVNNLYMLQGSRSAHRKWWLSHRFDLLDSKYVSGAYKAKSIEWKAANAPAGLQFSITSGNNIYYGYGLNNVPVETGVRLAVGKSHTFTTKQVINVGDPVRVYSAVNVQELDIHNFIEYLSTLNISEVYNTTVGTKLKKLVIGVDTATDARRNTSLSVISGLPQARRLEYLDISGYKSITDLDLSGHNYLTTLKAYESGMTGLTLANGAPVSLLELPSTMQSLILSSLPNLAISGLKIKDTKALYHINIRNCNKLQVAAVVFNWISNKTTEDRLCTLVLDNINWSNINAAQLISLGGIKDAGGTLSIKGRVRLVSATQEQVSRLREIFGDYCFDKNNELYITAPDAVFVTGPTTLLEGDTAQYLATVFSDYPGEVKYKLVFNGTETLSANGVTIDEKTGFVTTIETGSTRDFSVRARHYPTQGTVAFADIAVRVNARVYPSSISITGKDVLTDIADFPYSLIVTPSNVTGEYTTAWEIAGTAVEQGVVFLKSQGKTSCIITVRESPSEELKFTLKATVVPARGTTRTATKEVTVFEEGLIMTSKSNPEVMAKCYEAGWCSSPDKMYKEEAEQVTDLGITFRGVKIKTFNELRYFTGLTFLGDRAFYASNVTEITLPSSLVELKNEVFYQASFYQVDIPEGVTVIGDSCFSSGFLKSIVIPDSVTTIGQNALSYNYSLASCKLPQSVTSLGQYMLSGCSALREVTLPSNLTLLPIGVFNGCTNLAKVTLPDTLLEIGNNAFANCGTLTSIKLPSRLTKIGVNVFSAAGLTQIQIPASVTQIVGGAFSGAAFLKSISVSESNPNYTSVDGVLFNKNKTILHGYPSGKEGEEYIIPDGTLEIGEFGLVSGALTSIRFPSTVTKLNRCAFYSNLKLEKVTLPNTLLEIGDYAFYNCRKLLLSNLPPNVTKLGDYCFQYCESITLSGIPQSVTYLGKSAFYTCTGITSFVILGNILDIQDSTFMNCPNLTFITLPTSLERISSHAFRSCSKLLSITIPEKVTRVDGNSFWGCVSLRNISVLAKSAPITNYSSASPFGDSLASYTGRNTYNTGENMLYVPVGATGYDKNYWLDTLLNSEKCGFTISYTL